jgi:hypothetical protein
MERWLPAGALLLGVVAAAGCAMPVDLSEPAAGPGAPPAAPVAAAAPMKLAGDLAGWSSNLPVVVLATPAPLAAVPDADMVGGDLLVFEPRGGRTSLAGAPALSSRAGLRIRGNSSLHFPQKSYAIELRQADSKADRPQPVLGLPAEADFALVGAAYIDRSFIRNALAYALSNHISRWAPRTRFVEVFVVEGAAPLAAAHYQGIYTLTEKIEPGEARLPLAKLDASHTREPEITGGYALRIDHGASHLSAGGFSFDVVYPDWKDMGGGQRPAQHNYLEGYLRDFFEALATPNFVNPRTGRHTWSYIDVPAFIDHNLLNVLFKNVDGLRLSAYFHKPRGRPLAAGPLWDFDRSAGTPFDAEYQPRALEPREWARGDGTHPLRWGFWGRLFEDPAFKAAHTQRWQQLVRGPFSVENLHALIDRLSGELLEAQQRHFARWPEMPPTGGAYQNEVKALKNWFGARVGWLNENLPVY